MVNKSSLDVCANELSCSGINSVVLCGKKMLLIQLHALLSFFVFTMTSCLESLISCLISSYVYVIWDQPSFCYLRINLSTPGELVSCHKAIGWSFSVEAKLS